MARHLREYNIVIKARQDDPAKKTAFKAASYILGMSSRRTEVKGE